MHIRLVTAYHLRLENCSLFPHLKINLEMISEREGGGRLRSHPTKINRIDGPATLQLKVRPQTTNIQHIVEVLEVV